MKTMKDLKNMKRSGEQHSPARAFMSFVFFTVFMLALVITLTGQQQDARPTFRSGVDLIAVDVQVVDRDGKPIPALTIADFDVRIDGRKREVVSADLVSYDPGIVGKVAPPPVARIAPAVATPGRLFIVAVDEGGLAPGDAMVARDAARRFLKKLSPADYVGVFKVPIFERLLNLTKHHDDASKVFDRITGSYFPFRGQFNMLPSEVIDINAGDRDTFQIVTQRECDPSDPMCPAAVQNEARVYAGVRRSGSREPGPRPAAAARRPRGDARSENARGDQRRDDLVRPRRGPSRCLGADAAARHAGRGRQHQHVRAAYGRQLLRGRHARRLEAAATGRPAAHGAIEPRRAPVRDGTRATRRRRPRSTTSASRPAHPTTPSIASCAKRRRTICWPWRPEDRDRNGRPHFLRVGVNAKGATVSSKSHVFVPRNAKSSA